VEVPKTKTLVSLKTRLAAVVRIVHWTTSMFTNQFRTSAGIRQRATNIWMGVISECHVIWKNAVVGSLGLLCFLQFYK